MELKKLEDLEKFITILIVDDNKEDRQTLADALEQEEIYESILAVETAEEAFDYLPKTNILLADYQLPTSKLRNGIELVEKAKKQYGDKIQAIVFSGKNGNFQDVKKRAIAANASAFFVKPVQTEYIKIWIKELGKRIWMQQILENDPDEVLIRAQDGTILYVSNEKERIFGENLLGDKCFNRFEFREPEGQLCERCPDYIAFDGFQKVRVEWDYISRGDIEKHKIRQKDQSVDLVAAPLLDIQGKPRAIIEIARDITIRKTSETIIDEMEKEEKWENRRKIFMDGFAKIGINRVRLYLYYEKHKRKIFRMVDKRGEYIPPLTTLMDFDLERDIPTQKIIEKKKPLIFRRDKQNDNKEYKQDLIVPNLFWVGKINIEQYNQLPKDEWIDIPLIALDKTIGKVSIDGWKENDLPDSYDLEVLRHYCASAGQIISNARTRRDIEQKEKIQKAILEISKQISNLTKKEDLLKEAARLTCETIGTRDCSIFLFNTESNLLERYESCAYNNAGNLIYSFPSESYKIGQNLTGWAFKRNKIGFKNNLNELIDFARNNINKYHEKLSPLLPIVEKYEVIYGEKLYNCIFAPLIVGNEKIGLLRSINKLRPNDFKEFDFDEYDLEMFNLLAGQIAVAIFNANLQKEKEQVFLNISHSLISPIQSLKGYTEMIADGLITDPSEIKEDMNTLALAAENLSNLAQQVLSLSRIEANTLVMHKDYFYINDIVEKVLDMNTFILKDNLINIKLVLDPDNLIISADKNLITIALQGIVDNAIKFSQKHKDVQVSTSSNANYIFIEVKDRGIGIPKEEIENIWLKNYRGKQVREEKIIGSGIGLTVSNEIVKRHGGKIIVESQLGVGSIFTILLPKI